MKLTFNEIKTIYDLVEEKFDEIKWNMEYREREFLTCIERNWGDKTEEEKENITFEEYKEKEKETNYDWEQYKINEERIKVYKNLKEKIEKECY